MPILEMQVNTCAPKIHCFVLLFFFLPLNDSIITFNFSNPNFVTLSEVDVYFHLLQRSFDFAQFDIMIYQQQ
jgi:hypothetical protein